MQGDAAFHWDCVQRSYQWNGISSSASWTYLQVCFPSNLNVTGFSSCWITIVMIHSYLVWFLWWLRHGAIGPSEATSFVGLMSTDLTSEFTHFNLVIRWSNVQQLALLLSTVFEESRCSCGPRVSRRISCLPEWSRSKQSESLLFTAASACKMQHDMTQAKGRHTTFRCGLFSFGCLVRWNMLCT